MIGEIQTFLTGSRPVVDPDRILTTILFTDIAGSTEEAARLGDRWFELKGVPGEWKLFAVQG